ncbi:hypothetical protein THIOKS11320066 [Thiocapsa sp. KS1]|nr:hypothetical protein THIOKS11320066 [Thiocapsa sp. KS1]
MAGTPWLDHWKGMPLSKPSSRSSRSFPESDLAQSVTTPSQYARCEQIIDVSEGRVRRTLGNGRPLTAGELAFEAVEQPVKQLHLSLIQRRGRPSLPEPCFNEHGVEAVLCLIDRAMEGVEKPGEPLGDIHRPLLGPLQDVVVGRRSRWPLPPPTCFCASTAGT